MMRIMGWLLGVAVAAVGANGVCAESNGADWRANARAAIEKGVRWLEAKQHENGSWSNEEFPALTALPLWALTRSGKASEETMQKAAAFVVSCAHEDGAIWRQPSEDRKGGGLPTYNTAIGIVALNALDARAWKPVILAGRAFLARSQHRGDDMFNGGMGYDASTRRAYADLSNSSFAYEAMALTRDLEDLRTREEDRADLDWDAARRFIERCQNRPESNDQPWADGSPDQYGGFVYKPDASQAGSFTDSNGVVRLRSYGSMTYAGFLSFLYADVQPDDPRVTSAYEWAGRHWTLDENPGMGQQGLYYYFQMLAKALAKTGVDVIPGPDVAWRKALVQRLAALQQTDEQGGYWVNNQGRWWESDPVLATSYALLALESALGQ